MRRRLELVSLHQLNSHDMTWMGTCIQVVCRNIYTAPLRGGYQSEETWMTSSWPCFSSEANEVLISFTVLALQLASKSASSTTTTIEERSSGDEWEKRDCKVAIR